MTDERYIYNADLRERKRTAAGARAKKNGSRSKLCTMPSDHMTPAQKRQLNSSVEKVNLNRPMRYAQIKALSPTLRFLYLDHLINEHHARRVDLLAMLGVASSSFFRLQEELPGRLIFNGKHKKPAPEWVAFMANGYESEKPAQEPRQEAAQPPEDRAPASTADGSDNAPVAQQEAQVAILAGSITIRGKAGDIYDAMLRLIDDPEETYTFTVSFTK